MEAKGGRLRGEGSPSPSPRAHFPPVSFASSTKHTGLRHQTGARSEEPVETCEERRGALRGRSAGGRHDHSTSRAAASFAERLLSAAGKAQVKAQQERHIRRERDRGLFQAQIGEKAEEVGPSQADPAGLRAPWEEAGTAPSWQGGHGRLRAETGRRCAVQGSRWLLKNSCLVVRGDAQVNRPETNVQAEWTEWLLGPMWAGRCQ